MIQLLVRGAGASAKRHIAERPAHSLKCYVEHIMKKRPDGTGAVTKAGYISISNGTGKFIYEHVRVAEAAIGRQLPLGAQVHHVDGNPANNTKTNLVICPDQKYHALLHRRTRAYDACGNANYLICTYCGKYDDPEKLIFNGQRAWSHSDCRSRHRRSIYQERKANGKSV